MNRIERIEDIKRFIEKYFKRTSLFTCDKIADEKDTVAFEKPIDDFLREKELSFSVKLLHYSTIKRWTTWLITKRRRK